MAAARAAGGLAAAAVAPAAMGGGGLWYGATRWMLPSQNPAPPNLVSVQLEAPGGRVRSLTVQGEDVPLKRPFTAV